MTIEAARAALLGDLPADAWSYGTMQRQPASFPVSRADPRQNAPATISSLPLEQRRRAMVDRDEGRRQAYMRAFRDEPSSADQPGIPARYRLATYVVGALVGTIFWTAVFAAVLS